MRTASGLVLVAIGAILAFAVTTSPSFLNLQVAGWVLIVTGVAGMVIRRRGSGWRRVVRRPRGTAVNPGNGRRPPGTGGRALRWLPHPGPGKTRWLRVRAYQRVSDEPAKYVEVDEPAKYVRAGDITPGEDVVAEEAAPGVAEPAVETVEEFFQE
jgi:hypothetical protein